MVPSRTVIGIAPPVDDVAVAEVPAADDLLGSRWHALCRPSDTIAGRLNLNNSAAISVLSCQRSLVGSQLQPMLGSPFLLRWPGHLLTFAVTLAEK